jgi:hypothetical protein
MKTTILTLALAATLIAPAMGNQAIAGSGNDRLVENGFRLNGFRLNGFRLNGHRWNGFRLNGVFVNGHRFNGMSLQGTYGSDAARIDPENPFAGLDTAPLGR